MEADAELDHGADLHAATHEDAAGGRAMQACERLQQRAFA
jgi:hypothetical protein